MARMRLLHLGSGFQRYILSDVDDVSTAPAPPVFMILHLPDMMKPSVGGRQKAVLVVKDEESASVGSLLLL